MHQWKNFTGWLNQKKNNQKTNNKPGLAKPIFDEALNASEESFLGIKVQASKRKKPRKSYARQRATLKDPTKVCLSTRPQS